MKIKQIEGNFSVCKVKDFSLVDLSQEFCFVAKTDEELSLICMTNAVPANTTHSDDGWKAFRIDENLDFAQLGVLSKISSILAENEIGIFAVSTYNTDYIFVKEENYTKALKLLETNGYIINNNLA